MSSRVHPYRTRARVVAQFFIGFQLEKPFLSYWETYMNIKQALAQLVERIDLSTEEMTHVMRAVMTGAATPAQVGAFLVALRMKGETIDEITGEIGRAACRERV